MPLKFIDLNVAPVVAVNGDNRKAMGGKLHRTTFEKSTKKMITQNLGKIH